MDPDRWRRINDIFQATIERAADARQAFLVDVCAGDAGLREEVERLVRAHERAAGFLARPALAHAPNVLALADPSATVSDIEPSGRRVGPYRLLRELGRGGMGVVYLAERVEGGFEQRAVIKLIKRGMDSDAILRRFLRERQILAGLEHPNVARLLDGGVTDDGQPYFAMEYVDGQPLTAYCDERGLTVEQRLRLFEDGCRAVQHAHRKLVVHRDLKPSNILVTNEGQLKLLDFGIAKLLVEQDDDATTLTQTGARILTPAYAAPEQVRGEPVTTATDVYALGVVLYVLLTGRHPYDTDGRGCTDMARAVCDVEPRPPSLAVASRPRLAKRLRGDLDAIVLKALSKEPSRRYVSAEALAEDVRRHLLGHPVQAHRDTMAYVVTKFVRRYLDAVAAAAVVKAAGTAAAIAAVMVGALLWMFASVERVPVAVAPVGNQTGYAELDPYRLALTHELVAQLSDSTLIRVLPYERLTQIVRRFRQGGGDISSREALQALTTHSGAQIIIIPTLLYENGTWRARVELRDAGTATNRATYIIDGMVSSPMKDAAYTLVPPLAARIADHFNDAAPRRVSIANGIRRMANRAPAPSVPHLRTLDAAAEFEQGLDAYEQQEYASALRFLTAASERDERNLMLWSWRSRVARLMRRDDEAAEAAEQTARLLTNQTTRRDRLLIEAVVAEARRNLQTAEARHRELVAAFPDEPAWVMELAAFQDRRATADATAQAIGHYIDALRLDNRLARADLELCRLYGPFRQNERVRARDHGQRSLDASRVTGDRNAEAHALMCLTDVLTVGGDEDRRASQPNAEMARRIFADLRSTYNLPRAELYVGLGAAAQGQHAEAAAMFAQALQSARRGGNRILEPLLLMNLGVTQVRLGNRADAANYYQASSALYEALGDQRRAAQQLANRAALQIGYGDQPEEALRDMQNALAVFQQLGDKNFEAFSLRIIAAYHRHAGRHADAERELNRALAILRERNLEDDIDAVNIDRAQSHIDIGHYGAASALLGDVLGDGTSPDAAPARIHLARVQVRLGDLPGADAELTKASSAVGERRELFPLFHLVKGKLAYAAGRRTEARAQFSRATSLWTGSLPDEASVEARAYVGLIDALGGRPSDGRAQVQSGLEQAERMSRAPLAARCRLFLAQIDLHQRRAGDALRTLNEIAADEAGRTIGAELRAQVHYWRSQALMGLGDRAAAENEAGAARKIVEEIRASLTPADRERFAARPDVKRIIG